MNREAYASKMEQLNAVKKQEEEDRAKLAVQQQEELIDKDPLQKDPKDFGIVDNVKEVGDAVVGGVIDIYNSVGSLPKLLDPNFYKPDTPDKPYQFNAPWLIKSKPITETRWGSFLRGGIELAGGMVGTGKILWGVKGLKGFATAAKATRMGRVALGAGSGAAYDVISNQSQEQNLARTLIDIKPQWAGVLDPIATKENMSPAMKSIYNVGEGLGIGAFFDVAIEGAGWGLRNYSQHAKKAAKKVTAEPDPIQEIVEKSADIDYKTKEIAVEAGAREAYEREVIPTPTEKNPRLKDLKVFEQRREKTVLEMRALEGKNLSQQDRINEINKLNEVIHNYDTEIDAIKSWRPESRVKLDSLELPKSLRGAKPTYNYGKTPINLEFENDVAKALYIVGSGKASKRRTAYVSWLKAQGIQNPESAAMVIRANIKKQAKQGITDQLIKIPDTISTKAVRTKKSWNLLTKPEKYDLMNKFAADNDVDWGDIRDMNLRAKAQGKANTDLAAEQLEFDLSAGAPRQNPAYYKGGDVTDNQALSSSVSPAEAVRDMKLIRNDPTQKYGSPRGTLTEANIRRVGYAKPGATQEQLNSLAESYKPDPAYQALKGKASQSDMERVAFELTQFVDDSGHSRLIDVPEPDLRKYISDLQKGKPSDVEGLPILNYEQLNAADAMLGQLLKESRDLAKANLSVDGKVDLRSVGSITDGILARFSFISQMRKETSIASSWNLRRFGTKFDKDKAIAEASEIVKEEQALLKQIIQGEGGEDLHEALTYFLSASNGSMTTFKDIDTFFKRKLRGYKGADGYSRNALLNGFMTMGVNSMLSGPKTPVRALIGTGMGTALKPMATMLGSMGRNERVNRGAFQAMGAMLEARNDAWKKAVADFQSYNVNEDGWRGFTQTQSDREWDMMMQWTDAKGTLGDKAQAQMSNFIREINKSKYLNYGPRVMRSMDTFFTQIIGRGRLRQLAFDDVYERVAKSDFVVSDKEMQDLIKQAEVEFEGKVFSADGDVTDEMAKFSADEAKLTQELKGFAKQLDTAFDQAPFIRPFFLFARTGVNALKMTAKYTPILNNFITEHVDIMTKQWNDPDLLQYGIKSANDLEIAQSTMRGRMAIGYGVTSTAAWMALNGNLTGNGPPDRALRNSWIQNGWQPRSWRIGDTHISYEAIEPFNMLFSFVSDVVDGQKVMGDEWTSNQLSKISYLISANVVNKSFLAGLLQLQDLLTSQGGDAQRVLANFANNQVPLSGLRNEIGKVFHPGMRELESGFWESVGNRNLYADLSSKDGFMPYRYDILDGSKINDWNPLTRMVNAILPFKINVGTNETRELLFRTGLNLKQTFNTGPNGESFEGHPDMKSRYQFFMGQQGIETKLQKLFENPVVRKSIHDMEREREKGSIYGADQTLHGPLVQKIFQEAKQAAWQMLSQDQPYGMKAQQLQKMHDLRLLGNRFRKIGDYKQAGKIEKEIKALEEMIK